MALFKIEQGLAKDLAVNRPNSVQGYCYFTKDDGKFYIDIENGTALTPAEKGSLSGVTRMPINSYMSDWASRALADRDGNDITTYLKQITFSDNTLFCTDGQGENHPVKLNIITNVFTQTENGLVPAPRDYELGEYYLRMDGNWEKPFNIQLNNSIMPSGNTINFVDTSTIKITFDKGNTSFLVKDNSHKHTYENIAIPDNAITNNKLANSSISINGKSVSLGGSLSLADIGLNQALRFIGVTTTAIVDGSTATSVTLKNGSIHNAAIGDVIINELNNQEYVWLGSNWELLGDESSYEIKGTAQNLIDKIQFTPATASVLGASTTFTNGTSSVSFATHTTKNAVGTGATFTVTNPTITLSLNKTNVKATASGANVTLKTDTAITAIASPTTKSFVTSYPGVTSKLVTTTIKGVAGTASVSKISSNTSVTATKISSYGTAASLVVVYESSDESLVMTWTPNQIASGSNVTATNTVYSNSTVATANSATTTVATGTLSSSGTGGTVMTGLGTAATATAMTAMGALTTGAFATAINEITQPTITLATGATAGTGVISLATGSGSATASGGAVKFNSTDTVAAITGLGTATAAAQKITVGTNNKITALTSATTLTKS